MDDFTRWWMLLPKVPYMDKEELARIAFHAGQMIERMACAKVCRDLAEGCEACKGAEECHRQIVARFHRPVDTM